MPSYIAMSGAYPPASIKPPEVIDRETVLTAWRMRRLGMIGRYVDGVGVPGAWRSSGRESVAFERSWLSASQATDGVWYVRVPPARVERGWLPGGVSALVDLASAYGTTIAFRGIAFAVPAGVNLSHENFPLSD